MVDHRVVYLVCLFFMCSCVVSCDVMVVRLSWYLVWVVIVVFVFTSPHLCLLLGVISLNFAPVVWIACAEVCLHTS